MEQDYTDTTRYRVLKNGVIYDLERGRIAKSAGNTTRLTPERATSLSRARKEKTAALLRQRITEATNAVSELKHTSSASAVADVGGILWSEIVLDNTQYARDRLEAFEKIGKLAGIIPDGRDKVQDEQPAGTAETVAALTDLVRALRDAIQPARDVVEGTITDAD